MKFYCNTFICFIVILCSLLAVSASTDQNVFFDNNFPTKSAEGRIIGGDEVETIIFYPYQVQIMSDIRRFCSGVIITENYIVTAASCVEETRTFDEDVKNKTKPRVKPKEIKSIEVKAGNVVRGEGIVLPIQDVVHHPKFQGDGYLGYRYNLAYMKTVAPIEFSDEIQPCVLISYFLAANFTVTGWNSPYRITSRLDVLREVEIGFVPFSKCGDRYGTRIHFDMFCGINKEDVGACESDDVGNPASIEPNVVLGIVSSKNYCVYDTRPTLFTSFAREEISDFLIRGTGVEFYSEEEIPGITAEFPDPFF